MKTNIKKYAAHIGAAAVVITAVASAAVTPLPGSLPASVTSGDQVKSADMNSILSSLTILDQRTDGDAPVDGVDIVNKAYLDTAVSAAGDWQKGKICPDGEVFQGYNADETPKCETPDSLNIASKDDLAGIGGGNNYEGTFTGGVYTFPTISFNGKDYGVMRSTRTGRYWLDRNLGADQICQSSTDTNCYGDYYQWGRLADGHEKSTSTVTSTQATTLIPGHGDLISGADWLDMILKDVYRGAVMMDSSGNGVCPAGFRIPTDTEWSAEGIENNADAYSSLAISSAGSRRYTDGVQYGQGTNALLWSSSPASGNWAHYLNVSVSNTSVDAISPGVGVSLRCIAED